MIIIVKKADYWTKKTNGVQCSLCPWKCFIKEWMRGYCGSRINIKGVLYSLVYGNPTGFQVDPIEKKPFYHFNPGSFVYSFGTLGCNMRCKYCCNWHYSQAKPIKGKITVAPEKVVADAIKNNCQGIAYTYNEPSIFFEYARDVSRIAHAKGLFNVFVTNGLINQKPLQEINKYLDAVVIDFKGFNEKFYLDYTGARLEWVKQGVKYYRKLKAWKEITNLVVPGLNDNPSDIRKLVKFIKRTLGVNTPIHFIRFFPLYKATAVPYTSEESLNRCYEIAKSEGMNYVYLGNIESDKANTYCPKCGSLLITRSGIRLTKSRLKNKSCASCGRKILISGNVHEESSNPYFG